MVRRPTDHEKSRATGPVRQQPDGQSGQPALCQPASQRHKMERVTGLKLGHGGWWRMWNREDVAKHRRERVSPITLIGRPSLWTRNREQDLAIIQAVKIFFFFTLGKTFTAGNRLHCCDCSKFASLASPVYSLWLYANKNNANSYIFWVRGFRWGSSTLGKHDKHTHFSSQGKFLCIYIPVVKC